MSVGYVSYAAPIASSSASLGVAAARPAATSTVTAGSATNASVATGFDRTPATTPVTGGGGATSAATLNAVAAQIVPSANTAAAGRIMALGQTPSAAPAAVPTAQAANAAVSNQFGASMANNLATASVGGGAISDALSSGVAKIAAFAQSGMKSIEQAMQADMNANNGQIDPAKMQQYTMQMSTYETIAEMAKKIQDKQERAIQIWLQ